MRLQHDRRNALYSGPLQAATSHRFLFCFRKNRKFPLRFTDSIATIGLRGRSVSPDNGWDYQRVYQQDSGGEDE